ncbi:unnamed protein product [Coccothraustes coccothraustes]
MAEELPVDLRTRRPLPNPPEPPKNAAPPPPPKLRCRSGSAARSWGEGEMGETPGVWGNPPRTPNSASAQFFSSFSPQIPPIFSQFFPQFFPSRFEGGASAAVLGGGAIWGVAPPPLLPPPYLGVPPEPPLAAAIAAATRQDEDGDTPLHIAVAQGALAVARRLVALFLRGARPGRLQQPETDPAAPGVITGQVSLVRLLVAHGASPMCPDRLGRTCAHLACGSHLPGGGATAGPTPPRLTPLHVAVASGSRESVLLLLEHGADVDAGDIKSGRSPLLHAVESDSLEMAQLLLQHGASVNAQSYAGCTALHAAAGRGLLRLLRLLLRCGADCGLRNLHNDTAAGVAASAQKLQQELEFLEVQEEYIKDEQRNLKKEFLHAQEEVKRIQSIPLVIGQFLEAFLEAVDQNTAVVGSTTGSNYYVRILSTIDRELLKPNASVALHKHSNALVDVLPPEADSSIMMLTSDQKPDVVYADIGGMDIQKQEVREAVELPLTHFELYKQIGIDPPRGVLMYGPPGCGKTMLAKAVAHHTTAAFIRVVGSEFVQKYLGEGPRMVRDVFRLAKENAPAIIFIDEIDAIATKRFDAQTGADREVQRILLELLNQMDGFDQNVNVKVIMATNRADTLDPALLRPGRLDRKIEFPLPDRRQKRLIFSTITGKMNLSEEVDLEDYVARPDKISGADINSICQEAGMLAVRENRVACWPVRENRYIVLAKDFEKAYKTVIKKDEQEHEFYK